MLDILLIQPPIQDFYFTAKRTIPYGLACIAQSAISQGFSVEIMDCLATKKSRRVQLPKEFYYLDAYYGIPDRSPFALFHHFKQYGYSFRYMAEKIEEKKVFIAGISSLFTAYSEQSLKAARIVKQKSPKTFVVMGGHHPTAFPEKLMACEAVDFVIRGEGEISLPLLVKAIKSGQSIETIPGIVFRKDNGSLHVSSPAVIENSEKLCPPAMGLIKHDFYRRRKKGNHVIVASRGCPLKCTYCCIGNSSFPYRKRSVGSVMAEIETAVDDYNAGFIDFEDENLSLDRKWFVQILHKLRDCFSETGPELRAMNGLLPTSLDDKLLKLMRAAGFKTLNLSVGSTHRARLQKFRRPDVTKVLENIIESARKVGLNAVCYIIAGAPGQPAEESLSDILYLATQPVLIGLSIYYPAPGSMDYLDAEQKNKLPKHFSMMRSSALPVSAPTSHLQAVTLLRISRIVNFIKSLIDQGISIPKAQPCNVHFLTSDIRNYDRIEIGRKLLSWFLYDTLIRGITPDGKIFDHFVSTDLTSCFFHKFNKLRFKGAGTETFGRN